MKTRLLIICTVIVIVHTSNANALLVAKTEDQLYNEHDVILIGSITKAEGQSFDRVTDYAVSVEKYLKSDLGPQLQLSASGKKDSNLIVEDETIYEVGDRVLLYLIKDGMSYQISPYSTILDATTIDYEPCCDFTIPVIVVVAVIGIIYFMIWRKRK